MKNAQDQLAKRLFYLLLSRAGQCEVSKEVHHEVLDAQLADLYFEPNQVRAYRLGALGLLGRLAGAACLFEAYSSAPSVDAVLECIRKQLNLSKQLQEEVSEPRGVRPLRLWMICAGDPRTVRAEVLFAQMEHFPSGVYEMQPVLRVGLVVLGHLNPFDQPEQTRHLRLLGNRKTQLAAMLEVCQQPKGTIDRDEVLPLLLQYKTHLESVPKDALEDQQEAYMNNAEQMIEEIESRGEARGKARGEAVGELKGRAETVLKQLRLKFDDEVTPQIEAQVLSANLEQLERYTERVLTETALDVILREG